MSVRFEWALTASSERSGWLFRDFSTLDAHSASLRLKAPAYPNAPAGSDTDIHRRWRWGRKVLRQRRIVGRRRSIGVNRIGNVGAPAYRNSVADASADIRVRHTGRLHDGTHLRNPRKGRHCYPACNPRPHPKIHRDLLSITAVLRASILPARVMVSNGNAA